MNLIAIAAYGDWNPHVRRGKVVVVCTEDGTTDRDARRRKFELDAAEYNAGPRPFRVDPAKCKEVT